MVYGLRDAGPLVGGEGGMDGIEQGGDGGLAARRQFMVLDRAEGGLDGVEVRAGGW
jgi:hypothetical protein